MIREAIGAAAAVVAVASAAAADPRVDLEKCSALDRTALRRAVDAELAGIDDTKLAAVGDRAVIVDCPDAVTAHLQLDPQPTSGPIARSLDLGEVPTELRPRLVALAVVEVVEVAALIGTGPVEPPPVPDHSKPPDPHTTGEPIDPTPLAPTPPPPTPPAAGFADDTAAGPGAGTSRMIDRPAGPPLPIRRALADGGALLRGRSYVPRVGVRIYPSRAVPMLDGGFELIQGVVSIGVTGAIGQTDDPLGTVRPYLVAVTGGLTLACSRTGALEACASGRVAGGLAGIDASSADPTITAHGMTAGYVELGGQVELAWRGRDRAGVLAIDAGWSEGVIALAGMREAARLAGTVVVTTLGVRW